MRRSIQIAGLVALACSTTGCVMAARHVAREVNRSGIESKAKHRFPVGTALATARADLMTDGYFCLDMPAKGKTPAHVSCWPGHKTGFPEKWLVGGNWRYDLYGADTVTKVHIASAKHGLRRKKPESAPSEPAPASPSTT